MSNFNKYQFIVDLNEEILSAIKSGEIQSADDIQDWAHQSVENACIYYADCFDIIKELGFFDWSNCDYEISGVTSAAYAALTEYVEQNLDCNELVELIAEYEQE